MAEHIMEHIAHELDKDPLSVRMQNLNRAYPTQALIENIKEKSDYDKRKAAVEEFNKTTINVKLQWKNLTRSVVLTVAFFDILNPYPQPHACLTFKSDYDKRKAAVEEFNKCNVWKKRGISLVPMRFPLEIASNYHATVSVYRNDGTVVVTHGGVETGQGINTKAAQVCASAFGILLKNVVVKPTDILTSPNNGFTGSSYTSESVCYAVEECCRKINNRLEPIRSELIEPTWPVLIQAAYQAQINLSASCM
ncbi:hypothetical protein J6590_105879 [Homalodisca vitripennis]|nr:hypothetical protein J6590_105879 [Homalodisca vitripennis]